MWLDPVHKNFLPQMTEVKQYSIETTVKEMIESVCLPFITNSCLFPFDC